MFFSKGTWHEDISKKDQDTVARDYRQVERKRHGSWHILPAAGRNGGTLLLLAEAIRLGRQDGWREGAGSSSEQIAGSEVFAGAGKRASCGQLTNTNHHATEN